MRLLQKVERREGESDYYSRGGGLDGFYDGDGRLVPYTKLLNGGGSAGEWDELQWQQTHQYETSEAPTSCCAFFARLCRWPCAPDELKRDGMRGERTGGEGPSWLRALRTAHRKVNLERDGGGVDFRNVI